MAHVFRGLVSLLVAVQFMLPGATEAAAEEDILWTQHPVRIDRSKQHYERLPALQQAIDKRVWVKIPQRITILDGARFSSDGKSYRIGQIHAISTKRICNNADGTRWTCGRMAAVLLGNLVRGKRLLCEPAPWGKETVLNHCDSGIKDVAVEIIANGLGRVEGDGPLRATEELAREKRTGLWRNPDCVRDFDHC